MGCAGNTLTYLQGNSANSSPTAIGSVVTQNQQSTKTPENHDLPLVSVIVPCRNEERFIAICMSSLLANDYPSHRLEVIAVDGDSNDRTRAVLESLVHQNPAVKLLHNPKRIMPAGANLGIQRARGQVIMIIGAHARVAPDYISRCVKCLLEYGADNVGGVMVTIPQREGIVGHGIVACLSHRFGVGNAYFRIHSDQPRWVDTVFGGCYRREVFERIGQFNELLVCSQDMEFNQRLNKCGGKILFVPDIVSYYFARSDLKSFCAHNFRNGVWATLPFAYVDGMPVRPRHLIPLGFVVSVVMSALLAIRLWFFLWLLLAILGSYSVCAVAAAAQIAWRKRNLKFFFLMPLLFSLLHFGYGMGSVCGVLNVLRLRVARLFSANQAPAGV